MFGMHISDLHFELFIKNLEYRVSIYNSINKICPVYLFITGDICNIKSIRLLEEIRSYISAYTKIFYVLGNHEYYYSSIEEVTNAHTIRFFQENYIAIPAWAKEFDITHKYNNILVLGVNNFPDGKTGNLDRSRIVLNDYSVIEEYKQNPKKSILELGEMSATQLYIRLKDYDLYKYKLVIILMHAPPFIGAALNEFGEQQDTQYSPHFVSTLCGMVVAEFAHTNKATNFIILCGHTHMNAIYDHLDNLKVYCIGTPPNCGVMNIEFNSFKYEIHKLY